ncbi:Fatty acid hydroxylase superfamily protein [Ensifer adhaerens]|nr:Fatty acid hydroxylase superfamily protein [Ensifer adhaerens]
MYLSKLNYYSDFVVYPLCILAFAILGLLHAGGRGAELWTLLFSGTIVVWTLLEYLLHRFLFHHFPYIKGMHERHHDAERELLGTPVWLSLLAHLLIVFVPALLLFDLRVATAISAGIMTGYLWYVVTHHVIHHWHVSHRGYLYRLKRRHALHHHGSEGFNFGVTTGIWDRIFRTAAPENRPDSQILASEQPLNFWRP